MQGPGEPNHEEQPALERVLLRDYLFARDVPCPACGYNLRQLQTETCPECGSQLQLTVGVVGGLSSAWITTLVATLLPAGIGLPFHVLLLIAFGHGASVLDIAEEPQGVVFLVLLTYSMACIPAVITLLSARRKFIALKRETQKTVSGSLVIFGIIFGLTALITLGSII